MYLMRIYLSNWWGWIIVGPPCQLNCEIYFTNYEKKSRRIRVFYSINDHREDAANKEQRTKYEDGQRPKDIRDAPRPERILHPVHG